MKKDNFELAVGMKEEQYISKIAKFSLEELADAYEIPLQNLTDFLDLVHLVYEDEIRLLLQDEEFLNLPVLAQYSSDGNETFLLGLSTVANCHRAITVNTSNGKCIICNFFADDKKTKVSGCQYRKVRDILPLIDADLL